MTTITKTDALWQLCPGITNDGMRAHNMRDGCSSCAPMWESFPVCPKAVELASRTGGASGADHPRRLLPSGWCRTCRKFYDVSERPEANTLSGFKL